LHSFERTISKTNAGHLIATYLASVEEIGNSLGDHKVLHLLKVLKREALGAGPYPRVTMFEAANRILSDLVILYGVKWLLDNNIFPFESYTVEYGNENKNGFDICATGNEKTLAGEAFNVAQSFFQSKKAAMLKKLAKSNADYKIIMFNHDAVKVSYRQKPSKNEHFVFVRVGSDDSYMVPRTAWEPNLGDSA
jgi:hypothetical protein